MTFAISLIPRHSHLGFNAQTSRASDRNPKAQILPTPLSKFRSNSKIRSANPLTDCNRLIQNLFCFTFFSPFFSPFLINLLPHHRQTSQNWFQTDSTTYTTMTMITNYEANNAGCIEAPQRVSRMTKNNEKSR